MQVDHHENAKSIFAVVLDIFPGASLACNPSQEDEVEPRIKKGEQEDKSFA
jgi:hypothetical protein